MAKQCYKEGRSWKGLVGEWPVYYQYREETSVNSASTNIVSILHIGEHASYSAIIKQINSIFEFVESGIYVTKAAISKTRFIEGEAFDIVATEYERNSTAREKCISHHGYSCVACGFDFQLVYGDIGSGFIHIHHVTPISTRGGAHEVDPINDLVPLCPNCHAMVHRREPPITVDDLQKLLTKPSKKIQE